MFLFKRDEAPLCLLKFELQPCHRSACVSYPLSALPSFGGYSYVTYHNRTLAFPVLFASFLVHHPFSSGSALSSTLSAFIVLVQVVGSAV